MPNDNIKPAKSSGQVHSRQDQQPIQSSQGHLEEHVVEKGKNGGTKHVVRLSDVQLQNLLFRFIKENYEGMPKVKEGGVSYQAGLKEIEKNRARYTSGNPNVKKKILEEVKNKAEGWFDEHITWVNDFRFINILAGDLKDQGMTIRKAFALIYAKRLFFGAPGKLQALKKEDPKLKLALENFEKEALRAEHLKFILNDLTDALFSLEMTPLKAFSLDYMKQLCSDNLSSLLRLMEHVEGVQDLALRKELETKVSYLMHVAGCNGFGSEGMRERLISFLAGSEFESGMATFYLNGLGLGVMQPDGKVVVLESGKEELRKYIDILSSKKFQFPKEVNLVILNSVSDLFVLEELFVSPTFMQKYVDYLRMCLNAVPDIDLNQRLKRYYSHLEELQFRAKIVPIIKNFVDSLTAEQKKLFCRAKANIGSRTITDEIDAMKGKVEERIVELEMLLDFADISNFGLADKDFAPTLKRYLDTPTFTIGKKFAVEFLIRNADDLMSEIEYSKIPESKLEWMVSLSVMCQFVMHDNSIDEGTRTRLVNAFTKALKQYLIEEQDEAAKKFAVEYLSLRV